MLSELKFTDARKGFSSLYDEVFNAFKPAIIKRKKSEEILLLRTDLQKLILSRFSLKPEVITEDDNSTTLALDVLEIYVNSTTKKEALKELVDDLKLYAEDYIQRSYLFLHSPNRKAHFPYVLRIMLCNDDDEIRNLLEL